jgi:predicted transcriptional regulator
MQDLYRILSNVPIMESVQFLTRKGATCSDLISCLYNLKPMELDVLFQVARKDQSTLDEIANAVGRDRSTVHRSLSKLTSLGLVYKRVKSLKDGGYYHLYIIVEESKMKDDASLRVKEITQSLQKLVDNFITDFRRLRSGGRQRLLSGT